MAFSIIMLACLIVCVGIDYLSLKRIDQNGALLGVTLPPDAAALLKDKSALKKLLASPEAKKLMSMLTAQDTGQLKSAAEQAKNGDTSALLSGLMERPGGAQLMQQIEQKFPGKKS